jgi:hypothetical protein
MLKMVLLEHSSCMLEIKNVCNILIGEERDYLGDLDMDGRIVLKPITETVVCKCVGWITLLQDRV